jgi:hypothetical protein
MGGVPTFFTPTGSEFTLGLTIQPMGLLGPGSGEKNYITFYPTPTFACNQGACGNYVYGTNNSSNSSIDLSLQVVNTIGGRPYYKSPNSQLPGIAPQVYQVYKDTGNADKIPTTSFWGYNVILGLGQSAIPLSSISQILSTSPNGIYQLQIENINTPTPGMTCYDTRDGSVQWSVNAEKNGTTTYYSGGSLNFMNGQLQFIPSTGGPTTGFGQASTASSYFICFSNLGNLMFLEIPKMWSIAGFDFNSLTTIIDFGSSITVTPGTTSYIINTPDGIQVKVGDYNLASNAPNLGINPGMITATTTTQGIVNTVSDFTTPSLTTYTSIVYDIAGGNSSLNQTFMVGSTATGTVSVSPLNDQTNNLAQLVVDKYGNFAYVNCLWSMGAKWVMDGRDVNNIIFPSSG